MATLPPRASSAAVVGLVAGVAAFAVLAAIGRAPDPLRASQGARRDEARESDHRGLPSELSSVPERRIEAAATRVPARGAAEDDVLAPRRRDDPPRSQAVGADGPAAGTDAASGGLPQPGIAGPREERQPSPGDVAAVERRLAMARAEAQLQLQQRLNDEVAGIRGLLAQEQARREAESAAAAEAMARTEGAVSALGAAQRRLETGDARVLDALDDASPALPYSAQRAVQRAREAIGSKDLYLARIWVAAAIVETQRAQLNR